MQHLTRQQFIALITKVATSYTDEAEHQDSDEYWEEYNMTADACLRDFALTINTVLEGESRNQLCNDGTI